MDSEICCDYHFKNRETTLYQKNKNLYCHYHGKINNLSCICFLCKKEGRSMRFLKKCGGLENNVRHQLRIINDALEVTEDSANYFCCADHFSTEHTIRVFDSQDNYLGVWCIECQNFMYSPNGWYTECRGCNNDLSEAPCGSKKDETYYEETDE